MVRRRPSVVAALVAVVWGLCFILIQWSLPSPAPLLLAALRSLVGGAVLVVWLMLRGWRPAFAASGRGRPARLPPWRVLLLLALTNSALAFGAMYLAAGRAEAGVASVLTGGQPLILAAAGWLVFGERLEGRTVTGLLVAMTGVVLVSATASGTARLDGVALALLAAGAPVAGTVLMRTLAPRTDLVLTTSAQFLIGGGILLAASALFEPWAEVRWSAASVSSQLFLGVIGTGVAYAVWFQLLPEIPLVRLGTVLFLVPVTGLLVAILLGERPAPVELIGAAAMLAGVGLVKAGDPPEPRPPRPRPRPAPGEAAPAEAGPAWMTPDPSDG